MKGFALMKGLALMKGEGVSSEKEICSHEGICSHEEICLFCIWHFLTLQRKHLQTFTQTFEHI